MQEKGMKKKVNQGKGTELETNKGAGTQENESNLKTKEQGLGKRNRISKKRSKASGKGIEFQNNVGS